MNEIQKGNILIARFMGGVVDGDSIYTHDGTLPHFANTCAINELKYHLSWSWLMPVVEKISRIPIIGATENSDTCYPRTFGMLNNNTDHPMVRFNGCVLHEAHTLIEATWKAVVDFIYYGKSN